MLAALSTETLAALVAAALFGGMALFTFVLAPALFARLPEADSDRVVHALFPVYHLAGAVTALAAGFLAVQTHRWDGIALGAVAAGFMLARRVLGPAVAQAAEARTSGEAAAGVRFARLHAAAAALNLAQMAAVLAVAWRLAPP